MNYKKVYNNSGFTLAEVLVTLAIIGVVAILTIPNLVAHYQKRIAEVKLKKLYATFIEVINLSIADNGPPNEWSLPEIRDDNSLYGKNSKYYAEEFILPYLRGVEFCDTGYISEKCAKYVGCGSFGYNYTMADGTMFAICAYRSSGKTNQKASLFFALGKNDDMFRNRFEFEIDYDTGKILPAYFDETYTREDYLNGIHIDDISYNDGNGFDIACSRESDAQYKHHGCTAVIFLDGFKIKDDYPW